MGGRARLIYVDVCELHNGVARAVILLIERPSSNTSILIVAITMPSLRIEAIEANLNNPPKVVRFKLLVDGHISRKSEKMKPNEQWNNIVAFEIEQGTVLTVQAIESHRVHKDEVIAEVEFRGRDAIALYEGPSTTPKELILADDETGARLTVRFPPSNHAADNLLETARQLKARGSLLDKLGKARTTAEMVLQLGLAVSELNPIAKAVVAVVEKIYNHLAEQEKLDDLLYDLVGSVVAFQDYIGQVKLHAHVLSLTDAISKGVQLLADVEMFVTQYQYHGEAVRGLHSAMTSTAKGQVEDLKKQFDSLTDQFKIALSIQILDTVISTGGKLNTLQYALPVMILSRCAFLRLE
ncbi:hypothetical protein JAAARDRAFT_196882 [Jaapia argillacea MUCL 33604]|uniref:C2 domain-containing protein n=1 Tax=Jaapia argillacea MUCL 33604 TaxID=933084 RepID=A0A067PGT3_9AGAM|nr:hypothetical protein JAAARDRAFT_196882 [Jaapia argillacea MUCL 33604]